MHHRHGVGTAIAFGVVARLRLIAQTFLRRVCTTFHLRGFGRVRGGPYGMNAKQEEALQGSPRDSRQHVLFLLNSKGHRRGSHGPLGSQRARIPLDDDNYDKNNTRLYDPNIRHFCNAPPSGSASASNAANSTARKRDDDIIVLDALPFTVDLNDLCRSLFKSFSPGAFIISSG